MSGVTDNKFLLFLGVLLLGGSLLSSSVWAESPPELTKEDIKKLIDGAKQAVQDHRVTIAEKLLEKVLESDEDNAEALYHLAKIKLGKNLFKKGVELMRRAVVASPDNAVLHLNLARIYEESDFFSLAVDEYRKVMDLVKNPDNPVFREANQRFSHVSQMHDEALKNIKDDLELGKKLYYSGKYDEAVTALGRAVKGYPTYAEPYFFLGNIFLRKGDFGAGLKHMETSQWNAPNNARVQLTLGRVYEEGRQFDDAREQYEAVIKRLGENAPESQEARKRLALVEKKQDEIEKNKKIIDELMAEGKRFFNEGKYDEAEKKFAKVTDLDVGRAEAYYFLGRIYLSKNEYRKGGEYMEKAVQYSPRNIGLILTLARIYEDGGLTANATKYYNRALFYADPEGDQAAEARKRLAGMGEGLEPKLLRVIDNNPLDLRSRMQLSQMYVQQKKLDEAIGQLEAVIAIGSDDVELMNTAKENLALIYMSYGRQAVMKNDLKSATSFFDRALYFEPENPELLYLVGVTKARQDKLDEAIVQFKKALEKKPDYLEALENLALAYRVKKKYDLAVLTYSQAIALDPNEKTEQVKAGLILETLVEKYRDHKELDRAISIQKILISQNPKNAKYYLTMMRIYSDKKDLKGVAYNGEKLLEILPDQDAIRNWVARTYLSMGLTVKASDHLERLVRSAKDIKTREQAKNLLAQIERARKLRFNSRLSYNLSASGVLDNLQADPSSSSSLSLNMNAGFRVRDVGFSITLSPSYSLNHVGQSDGFNLGFSAVSSLSPHYKFPMTFGYSYSENGVLLTEVKSSFVQSFFLSPRPIPLKVPRKFWLLNDGEIDGDKSHVTLTLRTQANYQDQGLFEGNSIFLMRILSITTSISQTYRFLFGKTGNFNLAHTFRDNRNKHELGKDLALRRNQIQLSLSQPLWLGFSSGLSYVAGYDNHTNRDSDFGERRKAFDQSATASLSRSLFSQVSLSLSYNWTRRISNLDRGFIRAPTGQPITLQPVSFGDRTTYGGSWGASVNFSFKF